MPRIRHTLDNQADPTFNQLLVSIGMESSPGYFGSGAMGHPNKGYLLTAPYGQANYRGENWAESTQTRVTGHADNGVTVGFGSTMNTADNMNDNRAVRVRVRYFVDGDSPPTARSAPGPPAVGCQ